MGTAAPIKNPLRVFISYSWDSDDHKQNVLNLAQRLRSDGVDAHIDRFTTFPAVGWPQWMSDQLSEATFVLVVATERYATRFAKKEAAGKGLGATWEGAIITQDLYDAGAQNNKFIPVVFGDADAAHIPIPLRGSTHFKLTSDPAYEALYRLLTDQPEIIPAVLGTRRDLASTTGVTVTTVPPKEPALAALPVHEHICNLPHHSLGDLFKGREGFLKQLHTALHSGARAAGINAAPAIAATHGLGGIGKTRLAIEYGWLYADEYEALLFISGETKEKLETTFAALTGELVLDLPERKVADPAVQKAAVIKWLREHPRYFLIIDNIDDGEALKAAHALIDELPGGHIICTGRISNWPVDFQSIRISVLEPDDARDYLLAATHNRLPEKSDIERAEEMARELGRLALALEQAAAYINVQRITFTRYLEVWKKQHEKVMAAFEEQSSEYPRTFITTWRTSFEKLKPGAARLLELLAWFAPDPIPDALLEDKATVEMNNSHPPAVDADALADLFRYNLTTRESAEPLFTVHRLVQDVMRRQLEKTGRAAVLREQAMEWMNRAFSGKNDQVSEWPRLDPLAPHILTLAGLAELHTLSLLAGRLYGRLGVWTYSHGRYEESLQQSRLAIKHLQTALGPEDPRTLGIRNNLAVALNDQGQYVESEAEHRAVLKIRERVQGPEHLDTYRSQWALAVVLLSIGKHSEAQRLYEKVIPFFRRVLGPEHPDTLASRNNLAGALRAQGKHVAAEAEHRAVLEIRQRVQGPEHPATLESRSNLAETLSGQGQPAKAEPEYRAVLEIRERVQGSQHPHVFLSCFNLSLCLEAQGKKPEALALARRAFEGLRKTLGESHPDTLNAQRLVARLEKPA